VPTGEYSNENKTNEYGEKKKGKIENRNVGVVLRWQRNRTGRPLFPPQIHQKNI